VQVNQYLRNGTLRALRKGIRTCEGIKHTGQKFRTRSNHIMGFLITLGVTAVAAGAKGLIEWGINEAMD
jgi:hypothetical protein